MNRRWRALILGVFLAVFALQFFWNPGFLETAWPSDGPIAAVFRHFTEGAASLWRKVRGDETAEGVRGDDLRLSALELENKFLRQELTACREHAQTAERLGLESPDLLRARVISYDFFPLSKTALIDKGSEAGVRVNDVVLADGALAGRVLQVHDATSKILLLIDPGFAVDALDGTSGLRLLLSGAGGDVLEAGRTPFLTRTEYLENARDLKAGDPVVTSGLGGLIPKGIPIGRVDRVVYSDRSLFDTAWVLPGADFAKFTEVLVLKRRATREGE